VVAAINEAWSRRDTVLPALEGNLQIVLMGDTDVQLAEVDEEIREKQMELLNAGNNQGEIDKIGDAIITLREERQAILAGAAARQGQMDQIDDIISFLDEQTEAITEYLETLVGQLIEKITVYDEKLIVEFKSGLEIDGDA
jgi:hypothetical protein